MTPREVSKVGPILGLGGGFIIIFSIPISLILLSDIYLIQMGDLLQYIFSFRDILAILSAVGIIINVLMGAICIILSAIIYKKGAHPSGRPYIFGLAICGIIAMLFSIILFGAIGLIGLLGGMICLIGGYMALREIHLEPLSLIREDLKDQFVCERCGKDISKDAKFCPHCGVRYEE